ncbi:MAG: tetratricopeptide repeat protein [Pyrinomonadaceae bacterium]|nr:tetratricopeptide repeat protein [Pyrinomonadaceae bacterium]
MKFDLRSVTAIFPLCFVLFLTTFSHGQIGSNISGTGGRHVIQGSVFLPGGQRPETPVNVQLTSNIFTPLSVFTDKSGNFSFTSLSPGTYAIVVDAGEGFETAREYVTLDPDITPTRTTASSKTVTIPVYLQFKTGERLNNQVINAKLAAVPDSAKKLFEKGIKLVREEKIDAAISELEKSVAIYPQFFIAQTELGKLYLKKGNAKDAAKAFKASLAVEPNNFDTKLNYGIALLNENDFEAAEKMLKESLTINQNAVTPHLYLGITLMKLKKLDEAQKELELTVNMKKEKDFPVAHKYLGGIYWAKQQYALAANELEKFVKFSPQSAETDKIRETIKELRSKN